MLKKLLFFIIGLGLIAVVVFLGMKAAKNPSFVVWFGLSAAILAPTAFAVIGYGFRTDDRRLFKELAKVPEIDKLIKEAKTKEEKIALLEQERARLDEIIQVEARRQMLTAKQDSLEKEILRVLNDYKAVEAELKIMDIKIDESPAFQEIERIQQRIKDRRKGKVFVIKFGKREITLRENDLPDLFFPWQSIFPLMLKLVEYVQKQFEKGKKANKS